jgi:predicted  nucleic acid-binding Zn-ribbon protein
MEQTILTLEELVSVDRSLRETNASAEAVLWELLQQRAAIRQRIPGNQLSVYDALKALGRFPPIVQASNGYCIGCRLRLPPQFDLDLRCKAVLATCPHCHRMLYARATSKDGPST